MKSRRVASCVFCDDVRAEIGNKFSLMGVYNTDILFPVPPPVAILKLAVVVWIISEIDDIPTKFTVRVVGPPDRTEIAKAEAEGKETITLPNLDEYSKHIQIRLTIPLLNVLIQEEGFIEVMVEMEGEEPIRAGRLGVRLNVDVSQIGLPTPAAPT